MTLLIYYRFQEALQSKRFFINWISRSFYHCRKEIQREKRGIFDMKYNRNIVEIFLSRITRETKEKMILNYMRQKATNPIFFVISQLTNIDFDNLLPLRIAILNSRDLFRSFWFPRRPKLHKSGPTYKYR